MATCSGPPKKRSRKGVRYHMELNFANDDAKLGFLSRMERAKRQLASRGSPPLDNREVISRLLDQLDAPPTRTQAEGLTGASSGDTQTRVGHAVPMLEHSGIFTDSDSDSDQSLFVCERKTFTSLCSGLTQPCQCRSNALQVTKTLQKGHVLRVEFQCQACRRKRWWASSQTLGGKYIVNQKIVHAFTCAGILPSQYIHFSAHAKLGTLGAWYIRSVYNSGGYLDVVNVCAKLSMSKAITEVKALPGYSTNGEWVITDARHDSTANAFHTTVPCLSGSTKRVLACSTLSRTEHATAQTRELQCTKAVLPQVIEQELNVVEVAHDHQVQVKNYITEDLKLLNSYDTWHGTKNVAKQMKKVSTGTKKNLGKSWFHELSDKRKSTKVHLYYCMKNCAQSATHLRNSILNIVQHYQNQHTNCHQDSLCHRPRYTPTKIQLTSPAAIEAYEKALKETLIYRNAESYCRCRDTYWVESFNHQLLTYLPKRIHFGSKTFLTRMNLACMDWNENVCRASTSERLVQDLRRPDRRTAMKVLVKKTFNFVDDIWKAYVQQKVGDIREVDESESDEDQVDEDNELINDGVPMTEEDVEETVDEAEEE